MVIGYTNVSAKSVSVLGSVPLMDSRSPRCYAATAEEPTVRRHCACFGSRCLKGDLKWVCLPEYCSVSLGQALRMPITLLEKVRDRLLRLNPGESFQFELVTIRFTAAQMGNPIYSVVDDSGRLYYRGPFMPSMLDDVLALTKAPATKGPDTEPDRLYEQGMRLFGQGDGKGALKSYRRALELFQRESNDHSMGATWAKIGETYLVMEEHREAQDALQGSGHLPSSR